MKGPSKKQKRAFKAVSDFFKVVIEQGDHISTWRDKSGGVDDEIYFKLMGSYYSYNDVLKFEWSVHEDYATLKYGEKQVKAGNLKELEMLAWDFAEMAEESKIFRDEANELDLELDKINGIWSKKVWTEGDSEETETLWFKASMLSMNVKVESGREFVSSKISSQHFLGQRFFMLYKKNGLKEAFAEIMLTDAAQAWMKIRPGVFYELPEWLRMEMIEWKKN